MSTQNESVSRKMSRLCRFLLINYSRMKDLLLQCNQLSTLLRLNHISFHRKRKNFPAERFLLAQLGRKNEMEKIINITLVSEFLSRPIIFLPERWRARGWVWITDQVSRCDVYCCCWQYLFIRLTAN